ncbi:Asp-tRNA(Asn)/Glu-tRNA(Gln) amidotransferase GatCAB subunit A [Leptospira perolatii]|uniref:Glutamyl-tRNA(Gln) amidotransferase subunit A n=1 Tax=Leptospira perolatii TaxID=2023191 RepID=A0A2M9ZQM7_9LEPT|nr:Asp-tRNA(Asn)/Glu-tRNA(Gln) amidotransferase subunit GatA [Leptospira perolatii]PJZ70561.1 Asp-tRNA(Asn)/Glu-tRNA(Gln) amidotransferase GatCAB subunit A [Leptospira perolatii]PJZ74397.1 Asp-tRNA(Asn)/Glu-tRNA(Gln) amidotransferase GatCAB subunit A [Leptospira perolatii]
MKSLWKLKYSEIKKGLNSGEFTPTEVAKSLIERIETFDSKVQAFLALEKDSILKAAEESTQRRKSGKALSEFDGIPIGIKDNICIKDTITSCASKILENYKSPFSATVVERLLAKGFVLFPRANMDEFAMGSSTENSAYQVTKNPFDISRIPGGSSGGSAAAVAASMVPVALGSDTGGSIRQPASLCGIFGLKPTYGTVSRYGLVAYASSLDQIGPLSNDIQGVIDIHSIISGKDSKDATSRNLSHFEPNQLPALDISKLRIGVMKLGPEIEPDVASAYQSTLKELEAKGAKLIELDFSKLSYSIPIYYIIATAECSSNLSRFDGIRFGVRKDPTGKLEDLFVASRSEGFGKEVKRRILLGTFSLSAGYYDAYYGRAQKARALIRKEYEGFFTKVDLILQPTSPTTAFKVGEKTGDPIQMYKADILTTSVNLAGVPALSLPIGKDSKGLPIGLQVTASELGEAKIFALAKELSSWDQTKVELPEKIG